MKWFVSDKKYPDNIECVKRSNDSKVDFHDTEIHLLYDEELTIERSQNENYVEQ